MRFSLICAESGRKFLSASKAKEGTLWYYRSLVTAFREHSDHSDLIDELDRVVTEVESYAGAGGKR